MLLLQLLQQHLTLIFLLTLKRDIGKSLARMVLVTTFLLLRELHNWLTRYGESEKQYRLSEKEKLAKLRAKYKKLDNTNNNTLRWLSMKSNPPKELSLGDDVTLAEPEETELHKELSSVRAVLEMREEELRKLRWKLDRSQVNCDVKHIQTQTDDCSASVKKPKTFDDVDALFDGHVAVVQQNQYGSDLGQRGWLVTFFL